MNLNIPNYKKKRRREIKQITETLSELRTRVFTTERDALEGTTRTRILGGAIPGAEGHAAFSGGGTLRQNQALLALHEQMQQGYSEIDENNNQQVSSSSSGMRRGNNNYNKNNNDTLNLDNLGLQTGMQGTGVDMNTINYLGNMNLNDGLEGMMDLDMGNVPPPPNFTGNSGRAYGNGVHRNSSTRSNGSGSGSGDDMKYVTNADALTRDERDLAMLTVRLKQLHSIAKSIS